MFTYVRCTFYNLFVREIDVCLQKNNDYTLRQFCRHIMQSGNQIEQLAKLTKRIVFRII